MRIPAFRVVALVAALCFVAGALGYVVGRGRPPGSDSADVGFLYDMLHHHEQAVTMATLEMANGETEDIKSFAREIMLFQSYEIGLMDAQLQEWGYRRETPPDTAMAWMGHGMDPDAMPGMATEEQLASLRAARGRDADALFVDLMQDHHRGGVQMAEAAAELVRDDDVRELADRIATIQAAEIAEMEAARERASLP